MLYAIEVHGQLAQERIEREIASAALRRRFAVDQPSSIRRAIGHRFIQIGARIASEPSLESVRSR
jgi:hypothetical protein